MIGFRMFPVFFFEHYNYKTWEGFDSSSWGRCGILESSNVAWSTQSVSGRSNYKHQIWVVVADMFFQPLLEQIDSNTFFVS